ARVGVLALHLIVQPNRNRPRTDLPALEVPFVPGGLAEELAVVVRQAPRVLGPDHDAVQVHAASLLESSAEPCLPCPIRVHLFACSLSRGPRPWRISNPSNNDRGVAEAQANAGLRPSSMSPVHACLPILMMWSLTRSCPARRSATSSTSTTSSAAARRHNGPSTPRF